MESNPSVVSGVWETSGGLEISFHEIWGDTENTK